MRIGQNQAKTPTMPESSATADSLVANSNRAALLIVFLVVFIDLLGFGIVLPLLPRFADGILHHLLPAGKDSPLAGPILGALMSAFSLMQFFFSPVWGQLSDRWGRRPLLLLGLASSGGFYILLGVALGVSEEDPGLGLALLFVSRIGAGVAGATIGTAQAVIADSTPPDKRKQGMALIGAAFGIGFTFGPLVGFAALHWWPHVLGAVGYVAAALSLLAFILALVLLPETRHFGITTAEQQHFRLGSLRRALRSPTVGILVVIFFLVSFGFGSFESTLALYNEDLLGVDQDDNFLIFAYVGLVLLVTQGFLYRFLARRWSEPTFVVLGISFMGVGVASLGGAAVMHHWFPETAPGFLLGWVLATLGIAIVGFSFVTPSLQALISRRGDPERQGEVLGANQGASALARILGPLVGLSLYKLEPSHLLPYAFGAGLLFLLLPFMSRIRQG